MLGVAPPMQGPPSSIPGPSKTARDKLMQAARLLFDAIADEPALAGDVNDIIEQLTTVIRQSAEAPGSPPGAAEGSFGPPPLDRTPTALPSGGAIAGPLGGAGASPIAALARLMGRG